MIGVNTRCFNLLEPQWCSSSLMNTSSYTMWDSGCTLCTILQKDRLDSSSAGRGDDNVMVWEGNTVTPQHWRVPGLDYGFRTLARALSAQLSSSALAGWLLLAVRRSFLTEPSGSHITRFAAGLAAAAIQHSD